MSSDSESEVVQKMSWKGRGQREALFGNIFKKKMTQRRSARICHHEFKTRYANTTGLLRHLKHERFKHRNETESI